MTTPPHLSLVPPAPPTYQETATLYAEFAGSSTSSIGETIIRFRVDRDSRSEVTELGDYAGLMFKIVVSLVDSDRGSNNYQPLDPELLPPADMSEFIYEDDDDS